MYNVATIVGRLGKDPEQYNEKSPVKFSIATDEKFTDKNGDRQERTEWHNVEAWGKLGEICMKYLTKGKLVLISGPIRYTTSEKDGVKKYFTAINARDMKMLSFDDDRSSKPADDGVPF